MRACVRDGPFSFLTPRLLCMYFVSCAGVVIFRGTWVAVITTGVDEQLFQRLEPWCGAVIYNQVAGTRAVAFAPSRCTERTVIIAGRGTFEV